MLNEGALTITDANFLFSAQSSVGVCDGILFYMFTLSINLTTATDVVSGSSMQSLRVRCQVRSLWIGLGVRLEFAISAERKYTSSESDVLANTPTSVKYCLYRTTVV